MGGASCAILRAGFTYYNLTGAEQGDDVVRGLLAFYALIPSAGIGFLCGAIAGATKRLWLGALTGAVLSAGLLLLFAMPFAWLFALFGLDQWFAKFTLPYFLQKGTAGALGGAFGGFLGGRIESADAPPTLVTDLWPEKND